MLIFILTLTNIFWVSFPVHLYSWQALSVFGSLNAPGFHLVWCIFRSDWPPLLNVCVPDGLCSLSIGFCCWKGEMHHWRICRALCKHFIFFTKGRKTGVDYFCALPQGLQVSFETNSQLWKNYCHRTPVCRCQSKMTHGVLATLHFTSCSCLYRTILSSCTHPYAIPDLYDFFLFWENVQAAPFSCIDEIQCLRATELKSTIKVP